MQISQFFVCVCVWCENGKWRRKLNEHFFPFEFMKNCHRESLNSMRFRFYIYVECNNNLVLCICMMPFHPPSFIHMLITFFLPRKVFLLLTTITFILSSGTEKSRNFFFCRRLNDAWWNLYCCNHMCPACVLYSSRLFFCRRSYLMPHLRSMMTLNSDVLKSIVRLCIWNTLFFHEKRKSEKRHTTRVPVIVPSLKLIQIWWKSAGLYIIPMVKPFGMAA